MNINLTSKVRNSFIELVQISQSVFLRDLKKNIIVLWDSIIGLCMKITVAIE